MKKLITLALIAVALVSSPVHGFFGYEECYADYQYSYDCNCLYGCPRCR